MSKRIPNYADNVRLERGLDRRPGLKKPTREYPRLDFLEKQKLREPRNLRIFELVAGLGLIFLVLGFLFDQTYNGGHLTEAVQANARPIGALLGIGR